MPRISRNLRMTEEPLPSKFPNHRVLHFLPTGDVLTLKSLGLRMTIH